MANIRFSGSDVIVETIAARDSIVKRPDGLQVQVNDTTGDPDTGNEPAVYRWVVRLNKWALAWKSVNNTVYFTSEAHAIVDDKVTAAEAPGNSVVWDTFVTSTDGKEILAEVDVVVSNKTLTLAPDVPGQFDGKLLAFKYATGGAASIGNDQKLGDLTGLATTAKGSLVEAINEVKAADDLLRTDVTALQAADGLLRADIETLQAQPSGGNDSRVGDLATLNTTAKDNLVVAINEVVASEVTQNVAIETLQAADGTQRDDIGALQTQLGGINTALAGKADATSVPTKVSQLENDSSFATSASVTASIQAVVGGATPAALDTLAKIATQLQNDEDAAGALVTAVAGKEPTIAEGQASQFWKGDKTWAPLASTDINTALGYTPYNGAANPNSYATMTDIESLQTAEGLLRTDISALQTQLGDVDAALTVILGV